MMINEKGYMWGRTKMMTFFRIKAETGKSHLKYNLPIWFTSTHESDDEMILTNFFFGKDTIFEKYVFFVIVPHSVFWTYGESLQK